MCVGEVQEGGAVSRVHVGDAIIYRYFLRLFRLSGFGDHEEILVSHIPNERLYTLVNLRAAEPQQLPKGFCVRVKG